MGKFKQQKSDIVFDFVNLTFLTFILILSFYPIYFIIISSISGAAEVNSGQVWLLPKNINFDGYRRMLEHKDVWMGYKNTIIYTVLGTLLNLSLTLSGAFALSRKNLFGNKFFMGFLIVTMYFSGGMIPFYFLLKELKLLNTVWVMIIPGAVSVYNLIIARTFFISSIPEEIIEASRIDGCSDFTIFFKIVLPLSGAITAVLALYYAVGHWNSYFNAMMYLNDRKYFPLQLVLRELLVQTELLTELMQQGGSQAEKAMKNIDSMRYGLIIIASLPVWLMYPFIQKYFVKGVMIGAVKG